MNYELLTDELLLKLLGCDDEQAFQVIYKRHVRKIFDVAHKKVRNAEIAEDITQQVFMSIWERRQQAKIECLEAYLSTAVKFRCISYFESKYAKAVNIEVDSVRQKVDNSTEDALLYEELRRAIHRAMDLLPPKTRQVFQLSRFQSRTNREIAALLEISEKAVEYHVTQSLKVMRRELREYLQPAGFATGIPLVMLIF